MVTQRVAAALHRLRLGPEAGVVVGASGGVDSTVLLRLLHEAGVPVIAAHVDYGLRSESGEDTAFVSALADELGVPVRVRRVTLTAAGNRQEAAREARYGFFREVAEAEGAEAVAVGHTATDQAETVLMNLIRGAGQAGLAGMAEARELAPGVRLVRPLLDVTRAEVEALARRSGWDWREDASNATDAYRRNRLRHSVLPLLEEEGGPDTARRIAGAARRMRQTVESAEARLERAGEPREDGGAISLAALGVLTDDERRAVLAAMLRAWAPDAPRNESVIANIESLRTSQVGARVELGPTVVWRGRARLVVSQAEAVWEGAEVEVEVGAEAETPYGALSLGPPRSAHGDAEAGGAGFVADPHREVVDARALAGPLRLRPWREGDRFRPLGMAGTVLVSDLLTNRRVPPGQRGHQLVLTSGGAIVWVVGHRLADAARVTDATRERIALVWRPRG